MPFSRSDLLLHIINDRADRSRVDNLAHDIPRLNDERPGFVTRLAETRAADRFDGTTAPFFGGAHSRQDELKAELAAAQVKNEEQGLPSSAFRPLRQGLDIASPTEPDAARRLDRGKIAGGCREATRSCRRRTKLIFAGISLDVSAAFPAVTALGMGCEAWVAVDASETFSETKRQVGLLGVTVSDYATLMVEILRVMRGRRLGPCMAPWTCPGLSSWGTSRKPTTGE
jgi:hypothetical protein